MSEQDKSDNQTQAAGAGENENPAQAEAHKNDEQQPASQDGQENGAVDPEASSLEELPEWAKNKIAELRRESASYRTERNGLRDQLQAVNEEGDPAEQKKLITKLQEDLASANLKATRAEIARAAKLPDDADFLLNGTSEAELTRQAEVLAQVFGSRQGNHPSVPRTPPVNPRNPEGATAPDVAELIAAARARR